MRIWSQLWILLLVVFSSTLTFGEEKKSEGEKEPIKVFATTLAEQELFEPIYFGGFIAAKRKQASYSDVSGTIAQILVKEGQFVRKDQALLKVRPHGLRSEVRDHLVYAPISGIVKQIPINQGDRVDLSTATVYIADTSSFETTVFVTYDDLMQVKNGLEVDVLLAPGSRSETAIKGKITSIAPAADPGSGTFPMKVDLICEPSTQNCKQLMILGSMVKVVVKKDRRQGLKVSLKHIFQNRKKMLRIKSDQTVEWVEVKLGANFGDSIEVTDGVEAGDLVVVSYARKPDDGEQVIITTKEQEMAEGAKAKTNDKG